MSGIKLPKNNSLKAFARNLRKNATKTENHLWYDFLKEYQPQFYRQRIIGSFIVDFYCPSAVLVIELDGGQHFECENIEYDKRRTEYLNSIGLKVLRFNDDDVYRHFNAVCQKIDEEVKKCLDKR